MHQSNPWDKSFVSHKVSVTQGKAIHDMCVRCPASVPGELFYIQPLLLHLTRNTTQLRTMDYFLILCSQDQVSHLNLDTK